MANKTKNGFPAQFIFLIILGLLIPNSNILSAQPQKKLVEVIVTPTRSDWTYRLGEQADFSIKILRNGQAVPNAPISYEIGPEQMPAEKNGELVLDKGSLVVKGIKYEQPGFVRCRVTTEIDGRKYSSWGTAGFAPESITPVVQMPDDFDAFWAQAKEELASIPMDAQMTLMPEYCTPLINVYHVSLQNIQVAWRGNSRFYGMLSVPKAPGKYPAILGVPGAGVRPYLRDDRAANEVIVFKVGIHGIPVNLEPEIYTELGKGALAAYHLNKLDDRDSYYYKRVYLGCVRAIDFIYNLPEFDGENLAVTGGSQGGALSIITAGLDQRVKYLAAFYPALCDLPAYLEGRAGGWPHMFKDLETADHPKWKEVASYYDVVNFAKKLEVPGWYSWGYDDPVCPPSSMYAAYNSISSSKELHIFHETEHWTYPEQREDANKWLFDKLKTKQMADR